MAVEKKGKDRANEGCRTGRDEEQRERKKQGVVYGVRGASSCTVPR